VATTLEKSESRTSPAPKRAPRWGYALVVLAALVVGTLFYLLIDGGSIHLPEGYWTTPLPEDAPADPSSDEFIAHIQEHSGTNFIRLAGATSDGKWGNPIYEAGSGDPAHRIQNSCGYVLPPEFGSVRIPPGARPDPSPDSSMTVYDLDKGVVYGFYRTRYNEATDEWSSCGGAVYYLDSNGLAGSLDQSDEPRNFGHRGVPPFTYAVRHDEIENGSIDHILKIAVGVASEDHVWPMTGSDGGSADEFAPPEGARLRLKPSIDLSELDLTDPQRTIATALQTYGAVIGDQSGSTTALKLENTVAEGRGQLWTGLLEPDSLSMFDLDDFEVIKLGYGR
jgi:hypothetical protein